MASKNAYDETIVAMFSHLEYSQSYQFYAHMIAQCNVQFKDIGAPAGVSFTHNSYNLYIGLEKFSKYPLVGRLAILKHEMQHILENHVFRSNQIPDVNHQDFNIAADCAINQFIDPLHLPEGGILPKSIEEQYDIYVPEKESTEFYYDLLVNNKQENNSDLQTLDSHDIWKESQGDEDFQKDITKRMIENAIIQAQKSKHAGSIPDNISDYLELFSRSSVVNWKKVLKNIISNKKINKRNTIKKRNRRLPNRRDLKGTEKNRTFNVLVVADVSGSVDNSKLLEMIQEVKHICSVTGSEIDLIQVDTEASEPEKINKNTKIFERKGNGGTYLNTSLEMAKKHNLDFDAVVVCTDGYLMKNDVHSFNIGKPIIWLIEEGGQVMDEMTQPRMKAFKININKG